MTEKYELTRITNPARIELDLAQPKPGYAELCERCDNFDYTLGEGECLLTENGYYPKIIRRQNGIEECSDFLSNDNQITPPKKRGTMIFSQLPVKSN